MNASSVGGQKVSRGYASLLRQTPTPAPGTLFAIALAEGITQQPEPGCQLRFGRNRLDVELCVGEDDLRVSRQHGVINHRDGWWEVSNTGRLPIRLVGGRWLFPQEDPLALSPGYTPLFVRGSRGREHLLELYVVGPNGERPQALHGAITHAPERYWLEPDEKLVLVALAQQYLAQEEFAQPLTRRQVAEQMAVLQPDRRWDERLVERVIAPVRERLTAEGVTGLSREDLTARGVVNIGNLLNHNLIQALLANATLVPPDLTMMDGWD
jgi:hypothetical protein